MTKQLYIIDYECAHQCAHWCGGSSNVVVWAEDEDHALSLAESHMEEEMRELFSDEYNDVYDEELEEGDYDQEYDYIVNSVEAFGPGHDQWNFYLDPGQSIYYPVVGEPE